PDSFLATVNANGTFQRLQVLVPGLSAVDGSPTGASGAASSLVAGTNFNATVRAVDANFNTVIANNPAVTFGVSNDTYSVVPAPIGLSNGVAQQTFNLKTATTVQLQAFAAGYTSGVSAVSTVVPTTFTQLHVTLPGETYVPAFGSYDGTGGKAGIAFNPQAG